VGTGLHSGQSRRGACLLNDWVAELHPSLAIAWTSVACTPHWQPFYMENWPSSTSERQLVRGGSFIL
jgi:hypothetical protein